MRLKSKIDTIIAAMLAVMIGITVMYDDETKREARDYCIYIILLALIVFLIAAFCGGR